jgi:hypothetical protein
MNAPFFPPADVTAHVDRIHRTAGQQMTVDFARFERAHNAARPPITPQSDEQYEARPWAKPESMWRPM